MPKYIDREALIEWLKRIPLKDLSDGLGLCRVIFEDDFKKAIKNIPKGIIINVVQEWISVKDRMPEHSGHYLVIRRDKHNGSVSTNIEAYIKCRVGEWWSNNYVYDITHWMPLPEPPKGE